MEPEEVGFPMARQVARIRRQTTGRKDEIVGLLTSQPSERLSAPQWLTANRQAWSIENALHQRLDASLDDDRCRIRQPNSMWIMGIFRRLATSLFMEWRSQLSKPQHKSLTDFQTEMSEEQHHRAFRVVFSKRPSLKPSG